MHGTLSMMVAASFPRAEHAQAAGQRSAPYQPGATPQVTGPEKHHRAPTARLMLESVSNSTKNICVESRWNAHSALGLRASSLPSPLGWAGIRRAFGASKAA